MGATSSFIIVVVVVVVIIFMIGCICFQNSKRIRESFNASNVLKNFINNEDGLKQQVDVQGHAGLEFLGTFVVVQVARDTPPTLIDEIAEVEDWECSEDGECTGTLTYEVPSGGKRESFDLALREGLAFDVDLPALAYLGFRGTYLIAMVDATTEPRLLPGISTFVPADETSCTPGDQCEGVVTYNGDGDDNGGEPGGPGESPDPYVVLDPGSLCSDEAGFLQISDRDICVEESDNLGYNFYEPDNNTEAFPGGCSMFNAGPDESGGDDILIVWWNRWDGEGTRESNHSPICFDSYADERR